MKNLEPIFDSLTAAAERGDLMSDLVDLESRVRRLECGPILSTLHNQGRISLLSLENMAAIEALEHNDFWMLIHPLNGAIPGLHCSTKEMMSFIRTLVKKAGNDGMAGTPNSAFVEWCRLNPEHAREVVDGALASDEDSLIHCPFAIQALDDAELAISLANNEDPKIAVAGIQSLGRLSATDTSTMKEIVEKCQNVVENETRSEIRAAAINTAFIVWEKDPEKFAHRQGDIISTIADNHTDDEHVQVAVALFYHQDGLTKDSLAACLQLLASKTCRSSEVLRLIDMAMKPDDERWELLHVARVLEAKIPDADEQVRSKQIRSFQLWIFQSKANTSFIFSRWLMSGQFQLCSILADMISSAGENRISVEILKADLPDETVKQIFLARKCIGFFWLHEVAAASMLLSILKNATKAAREIIEGLLFNPLLLSYHSDLRDYLSSMLKSRSRRIKDCVERLLLKHDEYVSGLESAQDLVEFLPTIEQRRAAAFKDHERNNEISKQAREESIFAGIFAQQILLYGTKSFAMIHKSHDEKVPSVNPLSEFSYSREFPRLSVVDPVGFNSLLFMFRVERLISE